jgi:antitoxin component YwqK of YwqJK toxin-antitoxin module
LTPGSKVKSIVVTEEKYDMLVKKQFKESETYYDSKGNITESIEYKQGKVDKHFKYEYDAENNKIKEEEYDTSGRLKEISEYKYVNGLRTEKTVYDSNKKMKSKKTYTYTSY